jgi:anti-sigma regulatory factor (Ser/Thr protein kinase)
MDEFSMRFTATARGVRLARHLVAQQLGEWGYPYAGPANDDLSLITGELAANAVRHAADGGDFEVRVVLGATGRPRFRVEVTDLGAGTPVVRDAAGNVGESGRGLVMVGALAADWGIDKSNGTAGKVVWAEYEER